MLKVEQYRGLAENLRNAANRAEAEVGRTVILSLSFPWNMYERHQDTTSIVHIYRPPDIFLTVTCNPNWQEVRENLLPSQTSSARPDLSARVFNVKPHEILNDITKKHIFGRVTAYCYNVGFH
ncbi:Hypothetical predicted protein [Octopus vulgaris]|uniref:Helitron helicase-like domain-containing protein n=1 Tax=Octopus vulgaris TaxID=6645 RepID=A0AA36FH91_OCTVU|nr:Hypothetical predicted protein [Octopus vulgaris]